MPPAETARIRNHRWARDAREFLAGPGRYLPVKLAQRVPSIRSLAVIAVGAGVIAFLTWPMLFTSSGMGQDWSNHLWYVWRQSIAIEHDHQPSLFLDYNGSVFYPFYAFYGGTIYALAGTLTVLLDHSVVVAYVASYVLGFAATYIGWYLLGRAAGLGRWRAQIPGLLFITSPYYLTLVYARGDWPEFVAVSTLALFAAAGLRVLMAERTSIGWGVVLACCALVFFGSHNITMLWGVSTLAVGALVVAAVVPQVRRLLTRRGVTRVAVIVIPAALVNAWYLFPAIAYGGRTSIANNFKYASTLRSLSVLVSSGKLFTFSRASQIGSTPDFVLALPVLAVAWALLSVGVSIVHRGASPWRRALWTFAVLGIAVSVLMTHVGLILDLPHPYRLIQFSYRLETYVLIALSAASVAILALTQSWDGRWRVWSWTVVIVLIASVVGAIQQVDAYPQGGGFPGVVVKDRYSLFYPPQPPFSGGLGDYNDDSVPLVEPKGPPIGLVFPTTIYDEKVSLPTSLPAGTLVHTNVTGGPYLVDVRGAEMVGHDKSGFMVLKIAPHKGSAPQSVTLSRASTVPVDGGRIISCVALAVLALLLCAGVLTRLLRRRAATHEARAARA